MADYLVQHRSPDVIPKALTFDPKAATFHAILAIEQTVIAFANNGDDGNRS